MKRIYSRTPTDQHIDISPLIDMVFILLIFFMVTTTFQKDFKIELSRPQASTAAVASTKSIKVYIDRKSNVFVNEQPVRLWVLQGLLREKLRSMPNASVLVVTDVGVPASTLIEVVDQSRLSGAKDVGVATDLETM